MSKSTEQSQQFSLVELTSLRIMVHESALYWTSKLYNPDINHMSRTVAVNSITMANAMAAKISNLIIEWE